MSAHKSRIVVLIAAALLVVAGLGWRYVDTSGPLSDIQGTWHLKQVSHGELLVTPARATSLEFDGNSLVADDSTNRSTASLVKATRQEFFIDEGTSTAVGYPLAKDAREGLSRAPIQQLLVMHNAVTYAKKSNQLVLRTGGYTYTLVR